MEIGTDVWIRQTLHRHNAFLSVRSPSPTVSHSFSSSSSSSRDSGHDVKNSEKSSSLEVGHCNMWLAATIIDKVIF